MVGAREPLAGLVYVAEDFRLHSFVFQMGRFHSGDTVLVQTDHKRAAARDTKR